MKTTFCERFKDASPNLLRVSASALLLGASVYNIITLSQSDNPEKLNPWFFVFSAYSNVIYTSSNAYEAYTKLKPQSHVERLKQERDVESQELLDCVRQV